MNANPDTPQSHGAESEPDHLGYLLTAYLFDNLSTAGKVEVEAHLEICADCRNQLQALRSTLLLAEAVFNDEGKTYVFEDRRRQRILEAAARSRHQFFNRMDTAFPFRNWKAVAAVAAVLLVTVSVAFSALMAPGMKMASADFERSETAVGQAATAAQALAEPQEYYGRTDAPSDGRVEYTDSKVSWKESKQNAPAPGKDGAVQVQAFDADLDQAAAVEQLQSAPGARTRDKVVLNPQPARPAENKPAVPVEQVIRSPAISDPQPRNFRYSGTDEKDPFSAVNGRDHFFGIPAPMPGSAEPSAKAPPPPPASAPSTPQAQSPSAPAAPFVGYVDVAPKESAGVAGRWGRDAQKPAAGGRGFTPELDERKNLGFALDVSKPSEPQEQEYLKKMKSLRGEGVDTHQAEVSGGGGIGGLELKELEGRRKDSDDPLAKTSSTLAAEDLQESASKVDDVRGTLSREVAQKSLSPQNKELIESRHSQAGVPAKSGELSAGVLLGDHGDVRRLGASTGLFPAGGGPGASEAPKQQGQNAPAQPTSQWVAGEDGSERAKVAIDSKDDTIRRQEELLGKERAAKDTLSAALAAQNDMLAKTNMEQAQRNVGDLSALKLRLNEARDRELSQQTELATKVEELKKAYQSEYSKLSGAAAGREATVSDESVALRKLREEYERVSREKANVEKDLENQTKRINALIEKGVPVLSLMNEEPAFSQPPILPDPATAAVRTGPEAKAKAEKLLAEGQGENRLESEYGVTPTDPKVRSQGDVIVPPDVLARAELGDHFETINADPKKDAPKAGKPVAHSRREQEEQRQLWDLELNKRLSQPEPSAAEVLAVEDRPVELGRRFGVKAGTTELLAERDKQTQIEGALYHRGRIEEEYAAEETVFFDPKGVRIPKREDKVPNRNDSLYLEYPKGGGESKEKKENAELSIHDVRDLTNTVQDFPGPRVVTTPAPTTLLRPALNAAIPNTRQPEITAENIVSHLKDRFADDFTDPNTAIEESGGKIVVMNTPEVKAKIAGYLDEVRNAPEGFQSEWYSKNFASPQLQQGLSREQLPRLLAEKPAQAERTLRAYNFIRSESNASKALSFADFARRPAPVAPPVLSDEGMDEDAYIEKYGTRPYVDATRDRLSTFGMDVDTASYTRTRSQLREGNLPDPAAVRVEEFVNYFKQPYSVAGEDAFGVFAEAAPSPFQRSNVENAAPLQVLKIGIKSRDPKPGERKPAMLTFAIDTSGSMTRDDRLDMLRTALGEMVDNLQPEDAVSVVAFSDQAQVVLPRTQARQKQRILDSIAALQSNGGTNVEAGLALAYRIADESYSPDAVNRVILCSDGVANVGAKGPETVLKTVKIFASRGIDLATVGFGMGKYNDEMMVKLADNGNGSCHFADTLDEARQIFSKQLPPNLSALARDAKVQVDFNPQVVQRYRLLGYEKRKIADTDFRNDAIDAGEVQHSTLVTALYEIQRVPAARGTLGKVFLRWKDAGHRHLPVIERNFPLDENIQAANVESASEQLRFLACVARFAELLRHSPWVRHSSYADVLEELERLPAPFKQSAEWKEVRELAGRAQELSVKEWVKKL